MNQEWKTVKKKKLVNNSISNALEKEYTTIIDNSRFSLLKEEIEGNKEEMISALERES